MAVGIESVGATMEDLSIEWLSDATFFRLAQWLKNQTGIHLGEGKKALVHQRLARRLAARQIKSYESYLRLLGHPDEDDERRRAIDLLATHETFFFREPRHFAWFHDLLQSWPDRQAINVWSAAASTGEEVWSLAMVLADNLGLHGKWTLFGSDISQGVIDTAKIGIYSLERSSGISPVHLRKYCYKGIRKQAGMFMIDPELRARVDFDTLNLDRNLDHVGPFHVVFLRNVLIYFDQATKIRVLQRVADRIVAGGWLLVSHSESLFGFNLPLTLRSPGVYEKPL